MNFMFCIIELNSSLNFAIIVAIVNSANSAIHNCSNAHFIAYVDRSGNMVLFRRQESSDILRCL